MGAATATRAPASADWTALGCQVRLVVTDSSCLAEARQMLEADLAELDAACSRFREDSELSRLNRAGGEPMTVGAVLAEALDAALEAAAGTRGLVDPTVGTMVVAAGYDRSFARLPTTGDMPSGDRVGPVIRIHHAADWTRVEFDRAERRVRIPAGTLLDLGATAKAWAADRAAARVAAELVGGVLIGLGGDIAVAGPAPDGGWQVRLQDVTGLPGENAPNASAQVALFSGGIATSSVTARRWRRGGDVLHHIIDPRDGLPAAPVWRTVSVAADSCLRANAASTAAVVLGDGAVGWLAGAGLTARLISLDGVVEALGAWREAAGGGAS